MVTDLSVNAPNNSPSYNVNRTIYGQQCVFFIHLVLSWAIRKCIPFYVTHLFQTPDRISVETMCVLRDGFVFILRSHFYPFYTIPVCVDYSIKSFTLQKYCLVIHLVRLFFCVRAIPIIKIMTARLLQVVKEETIWGHVIHGFLNKYFHYICPNTLSISYYPCPSSLC